MGLLRIIQDLLDKPELVNDHSTRGLNATRELTYGPWYETFMRKIGDLLWILGVLLRISPDTDNWYEGEKTMKEEAKLAQQRLSAGMLTSEDSHSICRSLDP